MPVAGPNASGFCERDANAGGVIGRASLDTGGGVGLIPLMAEMIRSDAAGLDLVEAAGELIAENARFNSWTFSNKSDFTSADLWNLAPLSRKLLSDSTLAWNDFLVTRGGARDVKYAELIELLRGHRSQLREVRSSGVVAFRDPGMPPDLLDW